MTWDGDLEYSSIKYDPLDHHDQLKVTDYPPWAHKHHPAIKRSS